MQKNNDELGVLLLKLIRIVKVPELAKLSGLSANTLHRYSCDGRIPTYGSGRSALLLAVSRLSDLVDEIESRWEHEHGR